MKRPHLIFLPGWGMESAIWVPLSEKLRKDADVSFAGDSIIEWRGIESMADIKERVLRIMGSLESMESLESMGALELMESLESVDSKRKSTFQSIDSDQERSFILIGWSMGALAAIDVAVQCPFNIERLILLGGTSCFTEMEDYDAGWDPRVVKRLKRQLERDKQGTLMEFYNMMFSPAEQEAGLQDQFLQDIIQRFQGDETFSLLQGLDYLIESDFRTSLQQIKAPLLLIHGANDRICPSTAAEYIADYAGGSTNLQIMSGVGHAPFYTKLDECYVLIKRFIQEGDSDD